MNNKPEPEIPQFGLNDGVEQVKIGVVAVFDGHIGSEASETASRFFFKISFSRRTRVPKF